MGQSLKIIAQAPTLFQHFRYEDASQTFIRRTFRKERPSSEDPGLKMPAKRMTLVSLFSFMLLLIIFVPVYVPIALKYSNSTPRWSDAEAFVYFQPLANSTRVVRVTSISGSLGSPIRGFAKFHTFENDSTTPTSDPATPVINLHLVMSPADQITVVDQTTWESASARPKELGKAVILLSEEPYRPSSPLRTPEVGLEVPMFVIRREDVEYFQEFGRHQSLTLVKTKKSVPDPKVIIIFFNFHFVNEVMQISLF